MAARTPTTIARIEINQLFGQYTYCLPRRGGSTDISRLLILYGDNGTGKTTLLRLTYSLLAPPGGGRKSYIAKTVFQRICITFNDGTQIAAERPTVGHGSYTLQIFRPGHPTFKHNVIVNAEGAVTDALAEVDAAMEQLGPTYYFLSDDRKVHISAADDDPENPSHFAREFYYARQLEEVSPRTELELHNAMERVDRWLRRRTYAARRASDDSYDNLYLNVIKSVASEDRHRRPTELGDVYRQLDGLGERNKLFDLYGLSSPLSLQPFKRELESAPQQQRSIASHIAQLYIDSVSTRLDKLQQVRDEFALIQETFSSYLANKKVGVHLASGLTIQSASGTRLRPANLSSGERHLVLLLCNVIVARDAPSIFIIDEPELSLNIKWQRRLISTLLEFSKGGMNQFVLATHSFELLSQFEQNVIKLENIVEA